MTGNKALFTHLEDYNGGSVRFGDGGKAKVIGKDTVSIPCMTKLKDVYLADRLKFFLLSISQLCDNSHEVHFSANECIIVDKKGKTVLHVKRNPDNCYVASTDNDMSCNFAVISNIDLWHQRLGYINHNDLEKLSKLELVRGLPKLQKALNSVCGPCQVGKHIGTPHKKVIYLTTKRPLELLHMDFMGPTKFESIGGKKYIFLTVDDFSRLT
eukprot:TRINITY_DN3454_c0_g4_i2.p2 TRINITY_DN3454_c0_g4~~TRINITY_DN3454_c0_g4_i2.p2  ORF type:complete len:212 (-),score=25.08 TRINITY_DN3454_c0_g4_i2:1058-1693(-)